MSGCGGDLTSYTHCRDNEHASAYKLDEIHLVTYAIHGPTLTSDADGNCRSKMLARVSLASVLRLHRSLYAGCGYSQREALEEVTWSLVVVIQRTLL